MRRQNQRAIDSRYPKGSTAHSEATNSNIASTPYAGQPFNNASNAVSRRTTALRSQARSAEDRIRIRRASMNMQNGLREKGLANSKG